MEECFLSKMEHKDKTIYDIGAHIGIVTLFFAKAVGPSGRVVAFEPNYEDYKRIIEHTQLNDVDNVQVLNIGIGDIQGINTLVFNQNDHGRGSMVEDIQSQIFKERGAAQLKVEVDTLDACIVLNNLPKPDFIKIDIEGMEYNALIGMSETIARYAPSLYIEIHGATREGKNKNIRRIVELLLPKGYSIYHVESEQAITINNISVARKGHIFCIKSR